MFCNVYLECFGEKLKPNALNVMSIQITVHNNYNNENYKKPQQQQQQMHYDN